MAIDRRNALWGLIFGGAAVAYVAFGGMRPSTAGEALGFEAIAAGMSKGTLVLVDVREPDEFVGGHIPGSINLPLSRFDPRAVPSEAGKTTVILCRSGRRAVDALARVEATGRRDVAIYPGSMNEWAARQGPVVTGK